MESWNGTGDWGVGVLLVLHDHDVGETERLKQRQVELQRLCCFFGFGEIDSKLQSKEVVDMSTLIRGKQMNWRCLASLTKRCRSYLLFQIFLFYFLL